jgi:predicted TIM-barrel fold metal-dependent hydrolase
VGNEDGLSAAAEIRERAGDKNFVQVLLLSRNVEPLGQRRYWPIYQAGGRGRASRRRARFRLRRQSDHAVRLAFLLHRGDGGPLAVPAIGAGEPVLEVVFERYPKLKMVMIEAGFGWAPSLAWRLDKVWHRLRSEVPHVKRPPSEYIREQCGGPRSRWRTRSVARTCSTSSDGSAGTRLLFATDYPHWDYDEPSRVLPAGVSDANREAFYLGNARKLYGIA